MEDMQKNGAAPTQTAAKRGEGDRPSPGMGDRAHALLGASSSHRWLNCTPSAVAESRYPDTGSSFAEEGTLAHAMGARTLKKALLMDHSGEDVEIRELSGKYYSGEMDEYTQGYANFVLDKLRQYRERAMRTGEMTPEISIEQRLDYSDYVAGGFGTGDAVIVGCGTVEIIDLKYGKGVEVSAERNTQMMLYALGTLDLYDYAFSIDRIVMTIYQPRVGNVSTWGISVRELLRWAEEELRPLARLAEKGKGIRNSGVWCRFCKAKGDCPRLAAECMDLWQINSDSDTLTADELSGILDRIDTVSDWVSAIKERSLNLALGGSVIPGYKLVEGRSVRKITDPDSLVEKMTSDGVERELIFRPQELRTITDLEKTFGKKKFAEYAQGCVEKPKGKPALVPESDKRKAIDPTDDFAGIN